jgi:ankyrin repeat protein
MLIDGEANVKVADEEGNTPLHRTCSTVNNFKIRGASLEIMRELILAGADTQARDSKGRQPMEILPAWDREGRKMYEEAMDEMDRLTLRPVLK